MSPAAPYNPPEFWLENPGYPDHFWYDRSAYHFPLVDPQRVVRVPIAGPAPFNTLAIVRSIGPLGPGGWASGEIGRVTYDIRTDLKLLGYRPDRPEQQTVQHSSSATIRMMQVSDPGDAPRIGDENTRWVWAVDSVHIGSRISEDGHWIVTIDTANAVDQRVACATCEITSWVMFWEGE